MEVRGWTVRRSSVVRTAIVIGVLVVGFWLLSSSEGMLLADAGRYGAAPHQSGSNPADLELSLIHI